ncbi:RagB/SusD family nutrient uptake outer membrane protein [Pontibacter qinzhouensis]|uniref:RagB/SusD family nutrient uptake outer membrane protein n=1 Tax=Pontibacter qinzhouensis TaxID=2603253 RepID=A0A5C8K567_9BACT|nr:RagB/SusD family nutrient uptake outer membrane protein [Pontibacter qinzhouensis]TXK45733.1 RagB/SusD family nutrient uptake outer membrane protein [Pontibacter qinzhouensis]
MKNKAIIILFLIVALTSCKDFLDLQPEAQINDQNFFKTENDFEKAMIGVYGTFRDVYNTDIFYIAELVSDNAEISISSSSITEVEFDEMNLTPANTIVQSVWDRLLYTVSRCNVIINRLEGADINEATRNKILGEAKFMRAYANFIMVQAFGSAPISQVEFRSPEQIKATDLTLKPKEEVYGKIIEDLVSAETLLPAEVNPNKGHASRGSVKTLLGKVYLTQQRHDLAASKLKEVIDARQYTLAENYRSMFVKGNENLPESIFELKFISGANLGNSYSVQFTPASTGLLANNQQGSGRITPTLSLMNAYEADDSRREASVGDSITSNLTGATEYSRHGLKFVDLTAVNPRDGAVNFLVLRYADVLLMYAEALNEQGSPESAQQYVNEVRRRAGLQSLEGLSQPEMREVIMQERRVELAYEAHRWFDLVRTGRAQEVVNAYYAGKGLNFSIAPHELILPIPRREIEINPAIKQNTGY